MNLLPMKYFISVAKEGGISSAAKREFVTQQTMSAHMAALEQELGCTLFERRPRFKLTYEGQRFLQYCQRFVSLDESMEKEFADIRRDQGGVLRVAIATTRGRVLMPDIIARFRKRFPEVLIEFFEDQNDNLFSALAAGDVDVAIGRVPGENAAYASEGLYRETLMLVAPREFLTDEQERTVIRTNDIAPLAHLPFALSWESDIAGVYGRILLESAGIVPQVACKIDNAATLLALVASGQASVFMPDRLIEACTTPEQRLKMRAIPLNVNYEIGIAWPTGQYIDGKTQAFLESTRSLYGKAIAE